MLHPKIDLWLVIPSICLSLMGLLILRSTTPALISNQVIFLIISVIVFWFVTSLDFRLIYTFYLPLYFLSIVLLVLPYLIGPSGRGTYRWIEFQFTRLQPSELVKPILLIVYSYLAQSAFRVRYFWLIILGILPITLIFLQPDLGSSLVLLVGWLTCFAAFLSPKKVLLIVLSFLILILPVYKFALRDYQKQRLYTYLNPYSDPLGQGYHVIQSLIAVGSGGIFGRGLGQGTQSQLRFLPEHHTDFVFASLAEELGFTGSVVVILLILLLIWRIYYVSQNTSDPTATLFCLSSASLLTFQSFVNIGMNIGLVPVTGITLPFLSYGGSSILSVSITLGIINSISTKSRLLV